MYYCERRCTDFRRSQYVWRVVSLLGGGGAAVRKRHGARPVESIGESNCSEIEIESRGAAMGSDLSTTPTHSNDMMYHNYCLRSQLFRAKIEPFRQ